MYMVCALCVHGVSALCVHGVSALCVHGVCFVCTWCECLVCTCVSAQCVHGVSAQCVHGVSLGTSRYENGCFGTENIAHIISYVAMCTRLQMRNVRTMLLQHAIFHSCRSSFLAMF